MALNAFLRLRGETQGEIIGSVQIAGREDSIMVIASSHEIVSPHDAASGLPTGKRQHKPVVITKEIDKASPALYNALVHNERLTEWRLDFWQPSPTGQEQQYYTIQMEGARLVGIRHEMLNNKYPENMPIREREHLSFVYDRIVWTWQDGGLSAEDDWQTPIV